MPPVTTLETAELKGVEVLAPGVHNGDRYSVGDFRNMVSAFKSLRGTIDPPGKLGHDKGQQLAQRDGFPAIGWVKDLYVKDNKLIADFDRVPRRVADLIAAGAYNKVSSEIYFDRELNGKTYPRILKAVAFLGADAPAAKNIQSISDVAALYEDELPAAEAHLAEADLNIEHSTKEPDMDLKLLIEAYGLPETATEADVLKAIADSKKEPEKKEPEKKEGLLTEADFRALTEQVGSLTRTLAETTANTAVESAVQAGKVIPAQREWAKEYAIKDPDGFKAYVEKTPKLALLGGPLGSDSKNDDKEPAEPTDTETKLAKQLSVPSAALTDAKKARSGVELIEAATAARVKASA